MPIKSPTLQNFKALAYSDLEIWPIVLKQYRIIGNNTEIRTRGDKITFLLESYIRPQNKLKFQISSHLDHF